jgi:predicted Ser/Thr protein kinase
VEGLPQQQEQRGLPRPHLHRQGAVLPARVRGDHIYEKLLRSSLAAAVCAPGTLKMMAQFAVLTRLKEPENSSLYSKMQVYDGENLKDTDPRAKSYQEYRDYAGVDEGMSGISTRFAFKILSKVFNFDDRGGGQSRAPDVRA